MPQTLKSSTTQSSTLPGTTFGANLAAAREHVGLSREQLGSRAGLNAATIYRLEAGDRQPRLPTIIVLAKVLGMSASDLIRDL
jgi:transcriptional regulator with XRE-family HTH domain